MGIRNSVAIVAAAAALMAAGSASATVYFNGHVSQGPMGPEVSAAVSGSDFASDDSYLSYTFIVGTAANTYTVLRPGDQLYIPIKVKYASSAQTGGVGFNQARTELAVLSGFGTTFDFVQDCQSGEEGYGFCGDTGVREETFQYLLAYADDRRVTSFELAEVQMSAHAGGTNARAWLDPIFSIDQDFLDANPGFSLAVEPISYASGAPEPAIWALMIGGFGLAGAALRRRRVAASVA